MFTLLHLVYHLFWELCMLPYMSSWSRIIILLGQNYQRTGPQHRVSLMIPLLSTSWSPIFSSTNGSLLGRHFLVSAIITVNLLNWLLQEGIISLKSCRRDLIFRLWLSSKSYGKNDMIYVFSGLTPSSCHLVYFMGNCICQVAMVVPPANLTWYFCISIMKTN